jgi:hypothetical protein
VIEGAREFLELAEAADFVRLSEDYLRKSDCPRIKKGTRVVFWVEDLRRFMLKDRQPPLVEVAA